MHWNWSAVLVRGPSMSPTLRSGDVVLIRRGARVRPGDVVVAVFRSRPDLLVVKRAVRGQDGGWYVAGDNPYAAGDSAVHGAADVVGRVVLRCWPRPRRLGQHGPPASGGGAVQDSAAQG